MFHTVTDIPIHVQLIWATLRNQYCYCANNNFCKRSANPIKSHRDNTRKKTVFHVDISTNTIGILPLYCLTYSIVFQRIVLKVVKSCTVEEK